MGKTRVVVFSEKGARILTNPENLDQYKDVPHAAINPSLEAVLGIPPHRWALKNGAVVPRQENEPVHPGAEPSTPASQVEFSRIRRRRFIRKLKPIIHALIGAALALAIQALI